MKMTRREFSTGITSCVGGFVAAAHQLYPVQQSPQRDALPVRTESASDGLAWIKKGPLVIIENSDTAPLFVIRNGGYSVTREKEYRREHSEEAIRELQRIGTTLVIVPGYHGMGLEVEKPELEDSKELVALCHKYGIKVGVYIGLTIFYETLLNEVPAAKTWLVPDYLGKPVIYGAIPYRRMAYFMCPGYCDYMKRVLKFVVEDLKPDLVHFDHASIIGAPPIFFHPLAIQHFRDYLHAKYTPEMLRRRFGFSNVRSVRPPSYTRPLSRIDDPLAQEWTEFRCKQVTSYFKEMSGYIRQMNPSVAVDCNAHVGLRGINTWWEQGVDYPRLLSHMDALWNEEGDEAAVTEDGVLVSRIRTYKMGQTLNIPVRQYTAVSYYEGISTSDENQIKLKLAESMAYNLSCIGSVATFSNASTLPESARRYIRFFLENFSYYSDRETIADVAVLHNGESLAFNNDEPYEGTWLFEQSLIQAKVPFDIIFDENLEDLSKYRVLVLGDQECLNDRELSLVREFVRKGGGLVATGRTSLFTPWRLRRLDFSLADLFGVHAVPLPDMPEGEAITIGYKSTYGQAGGFPQQAGAEVVRNGFGKGRVVYIPRVKPAIPKPRGVPMLNRYWKLPLNWEQLIESVRWATGSDLSLEIEAPLAVTAEITRQNSTGAIIVHLINYDVGRNPVVEYLRVKVAVPNPERIRQVMALSPDAEGIQHITPTIESGKIVSSLQFLRAYSMMVLS